MNPKLFVSDYVLLLVAIAAISINFYAEAVVADNYSDVVEVAQTWNVVTEERSIVKASLQKVVHQIESNQVLTTDDAVALLSDTLQEDLGTQSYANWYDWRMSLADEFSKLYETGRINDNADSLSNVLKAIMSSL